MEYLFVYLWTRLDVLNFISLIVIIISTFLCFLTFIISVTENNFKIFNLVFKTKLFYWLLTIFILIKLFLPSKVDMLYIYFAPKIANSEVAIDTIEIIEMLPKKFKKILKETEKLDL